MTEGSAAGAAGIRPPAGVAAAADTWLAAGPAGPNQVYLGNRLGYRDEVDESMSGVVSLDLALQAFKRVALTWAVILMVAVAISVVILVSSGFDNWESVRFVMIVATVVGLIVPFLPTRLPLKEWHLLLDGRGVHAATAYYHVAHALVQRDPPVRVTARPLRVPRPSEYPNAKGSRPRHRLFYTRPLLDLVQHRFRATVSVFPYGRDLYVGWIMWWRISPFRMWMSFLGQTVRGAFDPQAAFVWIQRSDDIKAFKDLVHSVVREGVDASNYAPPPAAEQFVERLPASGFELTALETL